jgi:osmoprotectant transport system substrate-binding protein
MRPFSRIAVLGMCCMTAGMTVAASACSSSSSSSTTATTTAPATTAATGGPTIASKLTLGGPAECTTNAFCIPGLLKTYGITFKQFKTLDADGPITYQAITSGAVDVAEVFSTDAQIAADNLVVLNDDMHSQAADAITPVVRTDKASAGVKDTTNKVSAVLTTEILKGLNNSVSGPDKKDPQAVADDWLKSQNLNTPSTVASGTSISIEAFNFSESYLLVYIYGDALKAAGATVNIKASPGAARQTLEPLLQSGGVDMLIEYAASALEFVDKKAGLASGDINNNISHLSSLLQPNGVTVLTPAPAVDTNAFAVTKATAQKYSLANMSDLAKTAP